MRAISFRALGVCLVLLFCLSFVTMSGSANALPYAEGNFVIDWSSAKINKQENLEFTTIYGESYDGENSTGSYSWAYVKSNPDGRDNDTDDYQEDLKEVYQDTSAGVNLSGANAGASTVNRSDGTHKYTQLSGSVSAQGAPGIKNKAKSYAEQWMYFDVTHAGTLELSVDFWLNQEIDVETADEWAKAKTKVYLEVGELWFETDDKGNEKANWAWDEKEHEIEWKKTWGEFEDVYNPEMDKHTLTVSYAFQQGDLGYIWAFGKNEVEAYKAPPTPTPEPATLILLGSGLVGLAGFRRKFRGK